MSFKLTELFEGLYQRYYSKYRLLFTTAVDILIFALSIWLAMQIRFDFAGDARLTLNWYLTTISLAIIAKLATYFYFNVDRRPWRHASVHDAAVLLKAHFIGSIIFFVLLKFTQLDFVPRSLYYLDFILSLTIALGCRLGLRVFSERGKKASSPYFKNDSVGREVVVIGAGTSGHLAVKTVLSQPMLGYKVQAVFDDNDHLKNSYVHGVKVIGKLAKLERYLAENPRTSGIIVAIPTLSYDKLSTITETAKSFDIPVKSLQSFEEIAYKDVLEPKTKRSIEELLEREMVVEHEEDILKALSGKRILITGAGGSIGSELVRQSLTFNPERVILLDQCEYNLFAIQQEIIARSTQLKEQARENTTYVIADIVNKARLKKVFASFKPEIVLHAAAYKHVPLMEVNCYEAVCTNILGTRNLLELSSEFEVERFVLISTDKAVDPSSVMGSTKRVAEMMVERYGTDQHLLNKAKELAEESITRIEKKLRPLQTAAVRFGNVINSSGSVIPTFKRQILAGQPLTITHPDMTRYFMSIKQAVRLVLTAGTLGKQGEIYLLDMGQPIRIVDVAKKLRALYGRRDVPIRITGLREGEKLAEQLVSSSEKVEKSRFRKVNVVKAIKVPAEDVFSWVKSFEKELDTLEEREIGKRVRNFVLNVTSIDTSKVISDTDSSEGYSKTVSETNTPSGYQIDVSEQQIVGL
jgi:FlaA1/EpsC-like NDP-sugar epimerase